jgi:hypothetical protein
MKKLLLLTLTALGLLDLTGCGGGIEAGFIEPPAGAVTEPPPAEKPANYKAVKRPPGMPR